MSYIAIPWSGCSLCRKKGHYKRNCPTVLDHQRDEERGSIAIPSVDLGKPKSEVKKFFGRPPTPLNVAVGSYKRGGESW